MSERRAGFLLVGTVVFFLGLTIVGIAFLAPNYVLFELGVLVSLVGLVVVFVGLLTSLRRPPSNSVPSNPGTDKGSPSFSPYPK